MLMLSGVCQGFSQGTSKRWLQVLSDASLNVEAGEVVAVIGDRLTGKTTLLRIAAGLAEPESGLVRLDDVTLADLADRERSKLRGREVVWLNTVGMSAKLRVSKIVGWSIAEYRGRGERERRVAAVLERVGAADCMGLCWGDLSRFEQVLVAYAQAFAGRPRIIVVDDLLDGLGEPWTRDASDLLRSLLEDAGRSCGVLMSASDRDSALYADRVWLLDAGRLIPTAGHREDEGEADILAFRRRGTAADQ
jgi:putative ABC transport system ATP-binding protein